MESIKSSICSFNKEDSCDKGVVLKKKKSTAYRVPILAGIVIIKRLKITMIGRNQNKSG